jgi:serine/threonine protein kinase
MADRAINSGQEAESDALVGQTLGGKYAIEERCATGGMCAVYRATQLVIGKTVAVKMLLPQLSVDPQIVRRFEQEARTAGLIQHPHAINVFDFGQAPHGSPYIVMDFIAGEPLNALIRREGPLPLSRVAELLGQICSALHAAHEQGVIHRDVKPGNILISQTDKRDWVTVVDFGVAKIQEDLGKRSELTTENVIVGTPRYMSPEQAAGGDVAASSDIYSLGLVLYEMLTGEAPFQDESVTRLMIRQATEAPPPIRDKRPDVPREVEQVVIWALEKDPARRPSSVVELNTAFQKVAAEIGGLSEEDETNMVRRVRRPSRVVVPLTATNQERAERHSDSDVEMTAVRTVRRRPAIAVFSSMATRSVNWARRRPVFAVLSFAALVLGIIGVFSLTTPADAADVSLALNNARRTVAMAQSGINNLPGDHSLRMRLPELSQWEDELSGFTAAQETAGRVKSRAEEIESAASQYAEQAGAALEQPSGPEATPLPKRGEPGRFRMRPGGDGRGGDDKRDLKELEDREKELEKEREREKRDQDKRREREKKQEEKRMKKMREQMEKLFKRN